MQDPIGKFGGQAAGLQAIPAADHQIFDGSAAVIIKAPIKAAPGLQKRMTE